MKKTLYFCHSEVCFGEVWFDKDLKLVSYVQENDGNYREQYYSFIPKFFDVEIKKVDVSDIDAAIEDEEIDEYCEDQQKYLDDHKKELRGLIKNK